MAANTMRAIPFSVQDDNTEVVDLLVRATSSNTNLIPNEYLHVRGIGTRRELHLRPRLNQTGSTEITVSVANPEGNKSEQRFAVQVNPASYPQANVLMANAVVDEVAPAITLEWNTIKGADGYSVFRRTKGAADWGEALISNLPPATTSFTDTHVSVGSEFEYKILAGPQHAFHYPACLSAGIKAPLIDDRGTLILVVDQSHAANLAVELARLQQDLVGEGWTVIRHDVSPSAEVTAVKALIKADYDRDPARVKSVFLFGHVPIPYSGWMNPDGHYKRAFPADVFYADMDGQWTDYLVLSSAITPAVGGRGGRNYQEGSRPETRNYPGDGRYDPSTIPSAVELQIGRVDMFNLPAFLPMSEADLLKQYLDKDHNYRHGKLHVARRGLVDGWIQPYAQQESALVGPDQIVAAPFLKALSRESYVWAGRAQFGNYHGFNDGGGSTSDFARIDAQAVFVELFGSYFAEWDFWDDFLRAPLGCPTYTLASFYGSRPLWDVYPMALGEDIGYCARMTQNKPDHGYQLDLASGGVHIALLGDPTLRLHPVSPASGLVARLARGDVQLSWQESEDAVEGYHVYRAAQPTGSFDRLTDSLVTGTHYTDSNVALGTHSYMVRAVKLELSPCGTYFNPSQGMTCQATLAAKPDTVPPSIAIVTPTNNADVWKPINITAEANDNREVAQVEFFLDGQHLTTVTQPPYRTTWNETFPTAGSHQLKAVALDTSGNASVSTTTFRAVARDTIAPRLSITEPANQDSVWGNVIVRAAVEDNAGIDRVELWVDGARYATRTQPPFKFLWRTFDIAKINNLDTDSQTAADGPHQLVVKAFDLSGNQTEHSLSLTVDSSRSRPTILPASIANNPFQSRRRGQHHVQLAGRANGPPVPGLRPFGRGAIRQGVSV